ncbi:MAG: transposase [Microcoleus sp. PH2017_29_MFU_D_A]|jgi:putative transposase|uniref:RNA-guided endonuclease InsQ/TnpB family protein n=1 Tax=unclassified Microcoleus TaxID=2642155 RepID=UPI001DF43EB1|nr:MULTISPECIES: RNA-guided endonuclease TnpB family protein [unclassified Microcoleus]MCC3420027.1 transposase [Microcoleus sp. PH2017_07_MST_O_A]MCC3429780.1 transposase [Microcoleus sp. PH2017_04_SCI_O_A]MCC3442124.1 transposase [Microcoleus sp. PH2017_03_ELD_O_A]MCC3466868.1 transposase [Microcoleus sp. PH2017_06_SFM_O_A]MCC3501611.1 transposase [Microcoleus sp. PH2017_19_SFW_U_A]MCC3507688.1 transposase [Microcoleus sp. PH2017_17_BER_D_A]TAE16306.1 MAG: transposase [Oscillatoriales cyan
MTLKAFSYRFYPTPEQESLLRRTIGCVRLVYNRALAAKTQAWYEEQKRVAYTETSSMLTSWKKTLELEFLNEVSSVPLQQCLRHLQTAYNNFFDGRAKYPNFKKKRNGGSAQFAASAFKFKDGQVYLAKSVDPLPIRWSRTLPDGCRPSTITVKLAPSGRWSVSLLVNVEIETLPDESDNQIGIDLGITSLLALSTGEKIVNPKGFKAKYRQLRRAQKALSRKQKGSNNRHKARLKVGRVHQEIADARKDNLHKLTTRLVRENQTIAVENLAVKNMVKNRKLALAISDASWGELVRQLEYKCNWYGRTLIKIDRWFPSSKRCFECGYIVEKLPLNVREWKCPNCGSHHDRDINASKNILAAGLAVTVCGATVRPEQSKSVKAGAKNRSGRKQKPKS